VPISSSAKNPTCDLVNAMAVILFDVGASEIAMDGPIAGLRDTELQAVIEQERLTEAVTPKRIALAGPVCAARIERSARRRDELAAYMVNVRRTRCQLIPWDVHRDLNVLVSHCREC